MPDHVPRPDLKHIFIRACSRSLHELTPRLLQLPTTCDSTNLLGWHFSFLRTCTSPYNKMNSNTLVIQLNCLQLITQRHDISCGSIIFIVSWNCNSDFLPCKTHTMTKSISVYSLSALLNRSRPKQTLTWHFALPHDYNYIIVDSIIKSTPPPTHLPCMHTHTQHNTTQHNTHTNTHSFWFVSLAHKDSLVALKLQPCIKFSIHLKS